MQLPHGQNDPGEKTRKFPEMFKCSSMINPNPTCEVCPGFQQAKNLEHLAALLT